MLSRKWKSTPVAVFATFLFCFCIKPAEAHFFSIVPDVKTHVVPVGSTHTAKVTFTEEFLKVQAGAAHLKLGSDIFSARFLYNDGTTLQFPAFREHDEPGVEIEKGTDSHVSDAVLSKGGTVVLDARVSDVTYVPSPKMKLHYWGYSKQILNAKADGLSVKAVGGNDVLEIVPLSEVAEFAAGKTVRFRALFKGEPLGGAKIEWADEKSPRVMGDEGPTNTVEVATTEKDGTFQFTIKNPGYNCFGIMYQRPPAGTDRMFDYYASTLIVDVPNAPAEESGGGGCDGLGASGALGGLALAGAGVFLLRRKG